MKRINVVIFTLAFLLSMIVSGCGNSQSQETGNAFYTAPTTQNLQNNTASQPAATGFNQEMLNVMNLQFGVSVPSDVISIYGQPSSRDDAAWGDETVVTLNYSFGSFQFDRGNGDDSVLFYMEVFSDITGPGGIKIGMSANDAAECICAESSSLININTDSDILFYDNGSSCGVYRALTQEFVSEDSVYEMECSFYDNENRNVTLTISFDISGVATCYTITVE